MGVDLTIAPANWPRLDTWLCYDRIMLDRDYDLWKMIQGLRPRPARAVEWYSDEGLDRSCDDKYGERLSWVTAGELASLKLPSGTSPKNVAVWGFLSGLEPDSPVVLYWH